MAHLVVKDGQHSFARLVAEARLHDVAPHHGRVGLAVELAVPLVALRDHLRTSGPVTTWRVTLLSCSALAGISLLHVKLENQGKRHLQTH